jgi:hypothetical protein
MTGHHITASVDQFLLANGLDLSEVVADVTVRTMWPQSGVDLGPASPLIAGLVANLVEAGGVHAVDVTAFVLNGLECRAVIASMSAVEKDQFLDWLQNAPSEEHDSVMAAVKVRLDEMGKQTKPAGAVLCG